MSYVMKSKRVIFQGSPMTSFISKTKEIIGFQSLILIYINIAYISLFDPILEARTWMGNHAPKQLCTLNN